MSAAGLAKALRPSGSRELPTCGRDTAAGAGDRAGLMTFNFLRKCYFITGHLSFS